MYFGVNSARVWYTPLLVIYPGLLLPSGDGGGNGGEGEGAGGECRVCDSLLPRSSTGLSSDLIAIGSDAIVLGEVHAVGHSNQSTASDTWFPPLLRSELL